MFQEHNFIKRDHPELAGRGWRNREMSKKQSSYRLCLFFIDFFLCASMEFYYVSSPLRPTLATRAALQMCSCLTTSHPHNEFKISSLGNNRTRAIFTSSSETRFSHHVVELSGMGARQTASSSLFTNTNGEEKTT